MEHILGSRNTLYYPSEDDHPSVKGGRKAVEEFVPLLNVFYHRWQSGIDLAREVLGMPVKIGFPSGFASGLVREIENPIYATGVGLVIHELKHRDRSVITASMHGGKGKGSLKSIFDRMKLWFDEL